MSNQPTQMDQILNPIVLRELAIQWIKEDCPNFDYHPLVNGNRIAVFNIFCKMKAVLAGKPFVEAILNELDLKIEWFYNEGVIIEASKDRVSKVASVEGKVKHLLLAERTVLNVLSRCSGVATRANRIREMLDSINDKVYLAGTRKTTPGFRMVEKYGLLVSGALPHRNDLSSLVMIKDNHVDICEGSLAEYVETIKKAAGFTSKIEIECRNFDEVKQAAPLGVDIIMLDNFSASQVKEASLWLKTNYPTILVEVSGGISEENLVDFAFPSIDVISMGSLVQGYPTIDFSMKFSKFR